MDTSDLYDWEIAKIGKIWSELNKEFSTRPNTKYWLDQLCLRANEAFIKAGFVVEIDTTPTLIYDPFKQSYGTPVIEVRGRIPGASEDREGGDGFDHELKRYEVLRSKERGEKFAGQKDSQGLRTKN